MQILLHLAVGWQIILSTDSQEMRESKKFDKYEF